MIGLQATGYRRQAGVTLIELIVAIVIVGVAVASVMGVFAATSTRSVDAMMRSQATAIASAYLEEIQGKSFDPQPGTANRQDYDDVNDYNNLTDAGAHDQNGNSIAGLDRYQVSVGVTPDNSLPGVAGTDAYRIDVRVTDPAGNTVLMSGYKLKLP